MSVDFDPKLPPVPATTATTTRPTPESAAATTTPALRTPPPAAIEKPAGFVAPERARTHPTQRAPETARSAIEVEVEALRTGLRGPRVDRLESARRSLALASSYRARRSRGLRRLASSLLDDVGVHVPELRDDAAQQRELLDIEGALLELDRNACGDAMRRATTLADEGRSTIRARGRAAIAAALLQTSAHFPDGAAALADDLDALLEQAFGLAERAVAEAPHEPDTLTVLARVLLHRPEETAVDDAEALAREALALDPEHDGAAAVLANVALLRGSPAHAARLADDIIRRGNASPLAAYLRGLAHLELGDGALALRDLERALLLAPGAGTLALDAARAAELAGDTARSQALLEQARALLGQAFGTRAEMPRRLFP